MKIYCARREYDNEFDKYLGKDIWIHMEHLGHWYWVRLIDKIVVSEYKGVPVPPHEVYRGNRIWYNTKCNQTQFSSMLSIIVYIDDDLFKIVEPIETLTTEELRELMVKS